jgi:lipopolysaccharide transport system ATP-binding protein
MNSSDTAISVRNLTKSYRLFSHPGDRIKQFLSFGLKRYHHEFTALKNISFEVRKGETIGIIGRNGSGKSTLLQLICGILKPSTGSVRVNGRIAALLELGAGFNPEFTGRENVYFQGAIMGFTQAQMDERFEAIAAFAEIGEFIDQPVRTYSSGMFMRLAFAVATHVDADILIVDEALAVGDISFQRKCFERLNSLLANKQRIVLLVSHDLRLVERFCSRVIVLQGGQCIVDENADIACYMYYQETDASRRIEETNNMTERRPILSGTGEAEILDVVLLDTEGRRIFEVHAGAPLVVKVKFQVISAIEHSELFAGTQAADLTYLSASSTAELGIPINLAVGEHIIEYRLNQFPLVTGKYFIRFAIRDAQFRLLLAGEALCPFWVSSGPDEHNRPNRLLNLDTNWVIDGVNYPSFL